MSIAVSAVVQPSRILLLMVCAMSAIAASIGAMISLGFIGELSVPARMAVGPLMVILAVFGFYHGIRHRKPIHIDISGTGQLRLAEIDAIRPCRGAEWPHVKGSAEVVQILTNSTIWPHMLLLRLRADSGRLIVLPILPDCVSRDSFRALSVACRWIAAHNTPPPGEDGHKVSK